MDKEDLKSLLLEAAMLPGVNVPAEEPKEDIPTEEKLVEITEYNLTDKWDIIKATMEDEFAERFIKEMRALPGRDFIRVYMKMLEYIKPKIVRVEDNKEETEDNVVRIEIFNSVKQVSEEVVDITDIQEDSGRGIETEDYETE